jgi:DNA-binding XRE family transcriptional regulator
MGASKYKDEFCATVIDMGRDGKSYTQMAAACGVSRKTLLSWAADKDREDFREALDKADTLAEAYWEHLGMQGAKGILPKFNVGAYTFTMKNRFRETYKDLVDTKVELNSTVKTLTDEELDEAIANASMIKNMTNSGNDGSGTPLRVVI